MKHGFQIQIACSGSLWGLIWILAVTVGCNVRGGDGSAGRPAAVLQVLDSDGDEFPDGYELSCGTNPSSAISSPLTVIPRRAAAVRAISRQYLHLRRQRDAHCSLQQREAVWSQLMRASEDVKNELHDLERDTVSFSVLAQIASLDARLDEVLQEALNMPSTAQLQWRWMEASFDGIRRLTVTQEWEWDAANPAAVHWEEAGSLVYHTWYLRRSGSWSDSDGNGGLIATVEEAMNATSKPQKFHDTSDDNLIARGNWVTGTTGGDGLPWVPDRPGTLHGERRITTAISWMPETYSRQFREFRIRRSIDGDSTIPLFMNFLKSPEDEGVVLQPPGISNKTTESMKLDSEPSKAQKPPR